MTVKPEQYFDSLEDNSFTLTEFFSFLWLKKFRIALLAAVITVIGVYHFKSLPKIYIAGSTILLGEESRDFNLSSAIGSIGGPDDTKLDTFIGFMRSRQFMGRVVDELDLIQYAEFVPKTPSVDPSYVHAHAIEVLSNNLSLTRVGDTYLLNIRYESSSPEMAANVANHIGPAFFEYHSDITRQRADDATQWLNQQLTSLQSQLTEAESSLQQYLEDNQLIDVKSQIDLARTEISALLQEKLTVEKALAEVGATVLQVEIAGDNVEKLMQIPWVLQNSLVADIRGKILLQQQVLAEVSKRYKYKHHKHISAVSKLRALEEERKNLLQKLAASLQQEFDTLEQRSKSLENQISQRKTEHSELGTHELQLARLRRVVDSTQALYDSFVSRLQETEMLMDFSNGEDFAMVDFAAVPISPSKPRVALLSALLFVFATIFSTGFWLIVHLVSDRESRYRQLMGRLGVPILTEVPKLSRSKQSKNLNTVVIEGQKDYQFSEAIRSLRTALLVRPEGQKNRIIAVTGVGKEAGKSSIAISLAKSFSNLEKTMLVDLDLRNSAIAEAFKIPELHPGFTDFIDRKSSFKNAVFRKSNSRLSVMPAGTKPTDPLAYISNARFGNILQKLGILYERLVIETPSVNTFSEALVMAKHVDGLIVVCEPDATDSADLMQAIQKLKEVDAPLMGVVFNKVKNVRNQIPRTSKTRKALRKVFGY